jgi:hypothetical protein
VSPPVHGAQECVVHHPAERLHRTNAILLHQDTQKLILRPRLLDTGQQSARHSVPHSYPQKLYLITTLIIVLNAKIPSALNIKGIKKPYQI